MKVKSIFSLFLFFLSTALFAGDPDLFYYVSDDDNSLYSVDRTTGTSTLIGATGVADIEAIAYYPIPGANVLYAVNLDDFGTLNTSTGAFTVISEIDVDRNANGALGPQALNNVDGLMLDGQTFIMWATQRNAGSDFLFQIDVTTGKFIKNAFGAGVDYIVITGTDINVDVDDLAISPVTGRMYASNNNGGSADNLIEINKFNATYTVATALAQDDVEGMAFHNDGQLYGSEGDDDRFSEINVTTGAMTNFISLLGGDVECFASLVADANTVSGTVFNDDDLDGVLDGGESGVSGITVYLYIDDNADGLIDPEDILVQTTTTDGSGDYTFYYASTASLLMSTEFSSYPASSALTTDNLEAATFTDAVNFAETDANNNFGIGTGPDCDGDGLPNFFEGNLDSDGDAILDSCDLDSDNDGIRDNIEGIEDFDDDGIPNYRDRDSDDDGITDAIEANRGAEPTGYSSSEGNISGAVGANGIVDAIETSAESGVMIAPNPDSDNDGNSDFLDLDSDNDGILDIIEAGGEDSDNDGQVDGLLDSDSNGFDDRIEATPLTIPNTDLSFETTNGLTNLPNYIDIDSDSDGIDDTREGYSTSAYDFPTLLNDTDGDGILDFWDVSNLSTPITPYDRDSDDTPDYLDSDSDNDGITDLIEGNDANADGVVDVALSGVDADNNGLDDALDGDCGQATVIVVRDDYAEENNSDNSINLGSTDLELVDDGGVNQTVGVRFSNIDVDQGVTIPSAFLQFETDETDTDTVTITIRGELATNSAAFTGTASNVSSRTTTTASVTWTPDSWSLIGENSDAQRTPDVSSIVQEIVNQGGWVNGNSITFIITGGSGTERVAETDPILTINKEFDATPTLNITSTDYAEEDNSDGSINLGSTDLELANDGGTNQTVGIFFPTVQLSQGQIITSAYIQFQADEVQTGSITISIEGELSTNATTYTTTVNDVTSRSTTVATPVSWSPANWNTIGEAGTTQQTPDISTLIQEVVNQSGWTYGNNMSFIFTSPAGNRRTAETNPELVIETTASFSVCASDVAHQDFDGDGEDDFRDTDDDNDGIPTSAEPTDADMVGTVDYLESDASTCGLGFVTGAGTNSGNADVATNLNGITNPNNATGAADGAVAELHENGDTLLLDLTDIIPAGETYDIRWNERAAQTGTASMIILESQDGVTFTSHPTPPTTNSTTLITSTVTANVATRFIRIIKDDPPSTTDFQVDAVSYSGTTNCLIDSDNDGIANTTDIDDDNDGVLDVDEGNGSNNPVGDEDGDGTLNFEDTSDGGTGDGSTTDYTDSNGDGIPDVFDFDSDGIPNHLDLDSDNDGIPDLQEAGGTDTDSDGRADDPTDTDNDGWADTFDSDNMGTALADGNKDGNGFENRLDLDADDDGIADIIEAGGVDSNNDGQVDSATDTDGDGFADTFDNDNSGTPLPIEDEDEDGIQNYLDLDSDSDGIIDNVEGQTTAGFNAPLGTDTDGDGWDNRYDSDDGGTAIALSNNDGFGNPDYLDSDSDGDGLLDWVEGFDDNENGDALPDLTTRATNFVSAGGSPLFYVNADDGDGDGIPDWLEDDDGDNIPNFLDSDHGDFHDTDNDGIVDLYDTDNNGVASITPDGDGDGEYDFRDTDDQISLPVDLINFNAVKLGNKVFLSWETATETNNDYFIIDRSIDGNRFEQILRHDGYGNSTERISYENLDLQPSEGVNYYRLSQVDFDGKKTIYDKLIRVVNFHSTNIQFKLYPNPTDGSILYLESNQLIEDGFVYEIISTHGQVLQKKMINSKESRITKLLEGSSLSNGLYFLKITNSFKTETIAFIISN